VTLYKTQLGVGLTQTVVGFPPCKTLLRENLRFLAELAKEAQNMSDRARDTLNKALGLENEFNFQAAKTIYEDLKQNDITEDMVLSFDLARYHTA
jgi:hypothetical protein